MTGTRPQSDSNGTSTLTPLANAIKNIDTERDKRKCPHECHGSLTVDDGRVICESCRCTPDGVFIPPEPLNDSYGEDDDDLDGVHMGRCHQFTFFYENHPRETPSSTVNPKGEGGEEGTLDRYSNSDRVILPGGHEKVYDENNHRRPRGVTEEYTFDLTTL